MRGSKAVSLAALSGVLLLVGSGVLLALGRGRGREGRPPGLVQRRRDAASRGGAADADVADDVVADAGPGGGVDAAGQPSGGDGDGGAAQPEGHTPPSRAPLRAVLCKPKPAAGAFRPKILFIAGIEGSGHHGLVPLFRDLGGIVLIASAEQILTNMWDPTVPIAERVKLRAALLKAIQNRFDKCVEDASGPVEQDCGHFILFGRANFFSYPYDSPRNPLRHPDILELADMLADPSLGVRFDLKVLVLHREPYKTVQSNLRRGFLDNKRCLTEAIRGKRISFRGECDALWYLAREAEMQLIYMNAEVQALSAEWFRTVDFGELVKHPAEFVGPLSNFFELGENGKQRLQEAMLGRFRGSKRHNRLLSEEHDSHLKRFFADDRKLRWQLIQSGAFDLRALDGLAGTGERELGYVCAPRFTVNGTVAEGQEGAVAAGA